MPTPQMKSVATQDMNWMPKNFQFMPSLTPCARICRREESAGHLAADLVLQNDALLGFHHQWFPSPMVNLMPHVR